MMRRSIGDASTPARAVSDYPGGHDEGISRLVQAVLPLLLPVHPRGRDFAAPKAFATFEDGHRDIVPLTMPSSESRKTGAWVDLKQFTANL